MTDNQVAALYSLRDGQWRFGNSINGRHALVSLYKLGLVNTIRHPNRPFEWQITPEGIKVLRELFPELEKTG